MSCGRVSSPGGLAVAEGQRNGKFSLNGKLGYSCVRVTKGRLYDSRVRDCIIVHLGLNVSSSTCLHLNLNAQ